MSFHLEYPLISGRIYVTESQIICGSRDGTANVLYPHSSYTHPSTKQCNYVYTHPSTIQCNAAAEINNLKSSVSNGKSLIASAITDKGVSTAATFQTMANNIRQIVSIGSGQGRAQVISLTGSSILGNRGSQYVIVPTSFTTTSGMMFYGIVSTDSSEHFFGCAENRSYSYNNGTQNHWFSFSISNGNLTMSISSSYEIYRVNGVVYQA